MANFNAIELITKFNVEYLDEIFRKASVTNVFERNVKGFEFIGTRSIRIPSILMDGLHDYNRNASQNPANSYVGYEQGSVTVTFEEFQLSQDRGIQFRIDSMDNEETAGFTLGNLLDQFIRTQVAPEVDAWIISKIIKAALPEYVVSKDYTQAENINTVLTDIDNALAKLGDEEAPEGTLVMLCSYEFFNTLKHSTEVIRYLSQGDFKSDAGITFEVTKYNGMPIIPVPKGRLMSAIDTATAVGGFVPADGAKNVNWLIASTESVLPVKKHEIKNVFGPNVVQDFDGYKVNYRLYHDCFTPRNKRPAIYVSLATSNAGGNRVVSFVSTAAGTLQNQTIISDIYTRGYNYKSLVYKTSDMDIGADGSSGTAFAEGDLLTITGAKIYVFALDSAGKIVAKSALTTLNKHA